jgi:hypothetical protein
MKSHQSIDMSKRKHISWKTKCAAAVLAFNQLNHGKHQDDPYFVPYRDAKQMTEDQFLSLFHFDHNMLHSYGSEDRDSYYNLTPMMIRAHREKTKQDAKIIAKSRRIRAGLLGGSAREAGSNPVRSTNRLRSRGFDKTLRKKMDGTVLKREG